MRRRKPTPCEALALLSGALLLGSPAWANHFTSRRDDTGGQERGIVVSHSMELFEITTTAGGYPPVRRAEIIAGRLEELWRSHQMKPEMFSVGFRNGEVILQQQEHTVHLPHTVVTVDRTLAQSATGGRGDVERLSQWWLALLRDHICLAIGRLPIHTAGTPVGTIYQKLYAQLGNPTEPVSAEEIERAYAALPLSDREVFRTAARAVPGSYHPDRVIVVYAPPSAQAPHHDEEATEKDRASSAPTKAPPDLSELDRGRPPRREADHEQPAGIVTPQPQPARSGPATADKGDPRVKMSGDYKVILATDPKTMPVGKPAPIEIRLVDTSAGDAVVEGATVRGWLTKAGEKPGPPIPVLVESGPGTYGFQLTVPDAGDYRLIMGVITPGGDAFRVDFTFPVRAADLPDTGKATSPASRGPSARDRVRVDVTADGFIEAEWLATEPPVNAVTFTLLDAEGKTLATRAVTAAPFVVRFPRHADSYFADGLSHLEVVAEYATGVKAQVVAPLRKPAKTMSLPATKGVLLDSISDWSTFYREFCAAVARRDRVALKSCMVKNFLFTLEEFDDPDPRDAAFKEWDRPNVKGWEAMDRILAKGTRTDPMVRSLIVAPPAWVTDRRYTDYRVGFERRAGVWRWVWSMRGE